MKKLADKVDDIEVTLIHADLHAEKDAKYAKLINEGGAKATLQKYKEGRKLTILLCIENVERIKQQKKQQLQNENLGQSIEAATFVEMRLIKCLLGRGWHKK